MPKETPQKKKFAFSWTRLKNQSLNVIGNPFNVIVLFSLIMLFSLIVIPLLTMIGTTFSVAKSWKIVSMRGASSRQKPHPPVQKLIDSVLLPFGGWTEPSPAAGLVRTMY